MDVLIRFSIRKIFNSRFESFDKSRLRFKHTSYVFPQQHTFSYLMHH